MLAGAVNALAGGGMIFTFPALIAVGVPPLTANVTNTIASCPGYLGGVIGQWRDLHGQARRLFVLLPVAAMGGLAGGLLLLGTSERLFADLVPALVIAACLLLAVQDKVRALLVRRHRLIGLGGAAIPVAIAGIYGGYFGAGLSVMFLAVLGLAIDDSLTRLNGLKQAMSLVVNVTAALLFAASGPVVWPAAAAMAAGSLIGGLLGGRMASVVSAPILRRLVITIGVVVALVFTLRA